MIELVRVLELKSKVRLGLDGFTRPLIVAVLVSSSTGLNIDVEGENRGLLSVISLISLLGLLSELEEWLLLLLLDILDLFRGGMLGMVGMAKISPLKLGRCICLVE